MRFFLLLLIGLAACSAPPPPPAPQAPPPPQPVAVASPPAAQPTGDWTDWPLAAGDWVYRQDELSTFAQFGEVGAKPLLTIQCVKARKMIFISPRTGSPETVTIRTSSLTRNLPTQLARTHSVDVSAPVEGTAPILDAMIFSRGRFAIEVSGQTPLAIPSWPEIGRVVEDCRV